ncbi:MAG: hypothetical protein K8R16_05095 [Anaerolineales bacterium]|nr:hypothetical protein [Anaerolineales bacterium]
MLKKTLFCVIFLTLTVACSPSMPLSGTSLPEEHEVVTIDTKPDQQRVTTPTVLPSESASHPTEQLEAVLPSETDVDNETTSMIFKPENLLQSHTGVTVKVIEVLYTNTQTVIKVSVMVSSDWGYTGKDTVWPQQAYLNSIYLLDHEGKQIRQRSGQYDSAKFTKYGSACFTHTLVFEPIAPNVESLTLEIEMILLNELPADRTITFSLEHRELGDEWKLDENVAIGLLPFVLNSAKLLEAEDINNQFRLEFKTDIDDFTLKSKQASLACLYIYKPDKFDVGRFNTGCENKRDQIISFYEFGSAKYLNIPMTILPIEYNIVGDIMIVGPWNINWLVNQDT